MTQEKSKTFLLLIMNPLEWMKLEEMSPEFFEEIGRGIILGEKSVEEFRL